MSRAPVVAANAGPKKRARRGKALESQVGSRLVLEPCKGSLYALECSDASLEQQELRNKLKQRKQKRAEKKDKNARDKHLTGNFLT